MNISALFYLKTPKSDHSQIRLRFNHIENGPFWMVTGFNVDTKQWSKKKQRVKPSGKNATIINKKLNELSDRCETIHTKYSIDNLPLTKDKLKKYLNEEKAQSKVSVFKFIDDEIKSRIKLGRPSPGTTRYYKPYTDHFKNFCTEKLKREPQFNEIDQTMIKNYTGWLLDNGQQINHVIKLSKTLKIFLNLAKSQGLIPQKNQFKVDLKLKPTTQVYLSKDHLKALEKYEFTGRLAEVRDLIVFNCNIGMRYQDLKEFNKNPDALIQEVDDELYIDTHAIKTDKRCVTRINSTAMRILDKYDMMLPYVASNQKFNDRIEDICKTAELNEMVKVITYPGGIRTEKLIPFYKLVGTHTLRRSYATNAYLAGVPIRIIMASTGHTTEKQAMKYIRASALDVLKDSRKHSFYD